MGQEITSGSAFERLARCRVSAALPHAHHESFYSRRGTAIHEFLESVSKVGREQALDLVEPEFQSACAELNLDGLHEQLSLATEVAIAYDVETDTARELGRGEGRKYDDVKESELPATLDVVGVRPVAAGRRGLVIDWKTGWSTRKPIENVAQLDVGALLAARAYGCDVVEVQLIHVFEDLDPWVQRRVIEGWEIDAFAAFVREVYADALRIRSEMQAGRNPRDYNTGPWCDGCGARQFCPAQTALLRSVISRDLFDGPLRMAPIPDDALVDMWHRVHEAQSILNLVKSKVLTVASERSLYLGKTPDGRDRWLGSVTKQGPEKLDGEIVFDVIAELYGEECASAATKVTATKKDIEAAVKKAVPRGQGAKSIAAALERVRKTPGGSHRSYSTKTLEYVTKPQLEEKTNAADDSDD
jgi:hypothetical protein